MSVVSSTRQRAEHFGPVEAVPMSRVQQLTAQSVTRNWSIPHVTHHDEVDISAVDQVRQTFKIQPGAGKLSVLPFIGVAVTRALAKFPAFNCTIDEDGTTLLFKRYVNLGIAVDTPRGLVMAVVKNCESRDLLSLNRELNRLAGEAREGRIKLADMQGASFSISSLGGIGGTAFTPIINAPEVAMLGVTRVSARPVQMEDGLHWKPMLPLSLSYDHRVINGADAARFLNQIGQELGVGSAAARRFTSIEAAKASAVAAPDPPFLATLPRLMLSALTNSFRQIGPEARCNDRRAQRRDQPHT